MEEKIKYLLKKEKKMEKIFLVKEWTEGVTSWENINSETPYKNKKKALKDFKAKRDEVNIENKIIEEKENYENLDICRLIEIGIILKEKQEYNELIKKYKDCDLETFGNLCIKIYQKWGSCNPKDLKCEENFGYITEFLNNETEIVSDIIEGWTKESK